MRHSRIEGLLMAIAALALAFLATPLLVILPEGFNDASYMVFPPAHYSIRWFGNFVSTDTWRNAALTSIQVAAGASLLATTLGTLCATALDGASFRGKSAVMLLLISPLTIPVVILAIASYTLFVSVGMYGSIFSLMVAHGLLGLPFVVLTVSASLSQFDTRLRNAALSLGASPLRAFVEVTLPLILPGVATGAILALAVSFDDVVIATFLASQRTETLPMRMVAALHYEFDPTVAAVSIVLLAVAVIIFTLLWLLERAQAGLSRRSAS